MIHAQTQIKAAYCTLTALSPYLGKLTHAHGTHTQPFYGSLDFVRDNPDEPEETFTHSHLSWSSDIAYLLSPSITIHGILSVQLTRLTVFSTILSITSHVGNVHRDRAVCLWDVCPC